MARDWRDLFVTGDDGAAAAAGADVDAGSEERRRGLFSRLRENMGKTRQALGAELHSSVFQTLDEQAWDRLEETLIYADVGAATTARIVERLETEAEAGELAGGEQLTRRLTELLADAARAGQDHIDLRERPTVILMVGVNGTGKT
ncbi:MAG: signal recognition particle-docking protein FtsY, partial [Actinobacteria bacterium]